MNEDEKLFEEMKPFRDRANAYMNGEPEETRLNRLGAEKVGKELFMRPFVNSPYLYSRFGDRWNPYSNIAQAWDCLMVMVEDGWDYSIKTRFDAAGNRITTCLLSKREKIVTGNASLAHPSRAIMRCCSKIIEICP